MFMKILKINCDNGRILMSENNTKQEQVRVKEYKFEPQPDITAYELATILKHLNMTVVEHLFLTFDEKTRRHFK